MEFFKKKGPLGISWGIWILLAGAGVGVGLYLRKRNQAEADLAEAENAPGASDLPSADQFSTQSLPGYDSYYGVDPLTGGGAPPTGTAPVGINVGGEGTIRVVGDDSTPIGAEGGAGGAGGAGGSGGGGGGGGGGRCPGHRVWDHKRRRCVDPTPDNHTQSRVAFVGPASTSHPGTRPHGNRR